MTAVFQPQRASTCDNTLVLTSMDMDSRNSGGFRKSRCFQLCKAL